MAFFGACGRRTSRQTKKSRYRFPKMSRTFDHCIFLLIDGARPDAMEKAVRERNLRNLKELFFEEGEFRAAASVFPSTTGPAYAPFLTGCFPGTCDLPGIRWFDRKRYGEKKGFSFKAVRSYVGPESYLMNGDLSPNVETLFERLQPSMNVMSVLNRGVSFRGNKTKLLRAALCLYAHYTDDWSMVDTWARHFMLRAMDRKPRFLFVVFPGVDEHSHLSDPFSDRAGKAYADLDEAVGLLLKKLEKLKIRDKTLIVGSSDHGLSATNSHFELWKALDDAGRTTLYHPKVFRKNIDAAVMVSGNGMAHVYFKNGKGWAEPFYHDDVEKNGLRETLLSNEGVDHVMTRTPAGETMISSRRGMARLKEEAGQFVYQVEGSDPFGFGAMPERMTSAEALDRTFNSDYPDAIVQIAQLFRTKKSGDMLVTAAPGHDLRNKHEWPEHKSSHGSLHKDHMLVPFLSSHKLGIQGEVRTVDVFPTILKLMGEKPAPYVTDGRALL